MKQFLSVLFIYLLTMQVSAQETTSYYAETTGTLPFLEFGPGKDRLGGAKMTYIDTAISLQIVDSLHSNYLVQLSNNHRAFIPKRFLGPMHKQDQAPYHLTGSWSVYGDESYDYVRIQLDQRLPYQSIQEINPSRIVVDIFGATSNTNWITQKTNVKEIKNVYHQQVEDDVFRVYIDLNNQTHWGYHIAYEGNTLVIRIKRSPEKKRLKDLKIAIDAGHGGSNLGARGGTGILEKDYTLRFAKALQKQLSKKGAETYMTRENDVDLSMSDRLLMLEEAQPDLLISLHLNSASRRSAKGVSTYYRYIGFRPLSQSILSRMLDLDLEEFGNIGSFNFTLNGATAYPNCLVEIAFISNPEDEQRIQDPKFQEQVARQIRRGIKDWLKRQEKGFIP